MASQVENEMKRSTLKQCVEEIAREVERWGYGFWAENRSPVTFNREMFGEELQVEAQTIEHTEDYIHVGVSVDDGRWFNAMCPLSTSFLIRKDVHGQDE